MHKLILAIFIAVLIIQIACVNKAYADEIKECLELHGLPPDYVEKLKKEEMDDKTLCFAKCVMEKREFIDDNGKLIMENVNKDIESHQKASEESRKIAKNCMSLIDQISSCADSLKFNACLSPVWCSEDGK
uniref:Uncharacterized protein LOC114348771 n=1 Tax=Diabrotica virgifera virgifera TaxID=50390 RepID=A0A6P7H8X3_DIAVI